MAMLSFKILPGNGFPSFTRLKKPLLVVSPSRASTIHCSLRYETQSQISLDDSEGFTPIKGLATEEGKPDEEKGISGIHVPRQRYISVPKVELLDSILSMFDSKEDADEFARLSSCLDAILHAEHKAILEEMRAYYSFSDTKKQDTAGLSSSGLEESLSVNQYFPLGTENQEMDGQRNKEFFRPLYLGNVLELKRLFEKPPEINTTLSESRLATDFQQAFMKLLQDAEFEELSAQDLMLTYALNNDYLLTLPIYVDWKKASKSNAIIFRRGYATERQKGLLLVEKLDFLQSKLLQGIFFSLSRPLKKIGGWINEALKSSSEAADMQIWIDKVKLWLKERYSLERTKFMVESRSKNELNSEQIGDGKLPIWLAAQRAVARYEGFLSSVGPRGRLIRKLLTWMEIIPSMPEASLDLKEETSYSEAYLRQTFLPRITLSNIWEPASRESCGGNVWKMFQNAVSILFSKSILQEPAFQELILLYTEETSQNEYNGQLEGLPLQMKIYERIPIPELQVIFPHKKLSFRILDTVRLDIASLLGLLAFFVNYKFENILSSPSAVLLDVIATSALIIYVTRVALGYKQTWDRYQLLVNRTLYEKTLASGFGSVYFLLDASQQQQYKEAILVYAVLLHSKNNQLAKKAIEKKIWQIK
ncbi:Tetratricopeptide-like helical domain-containing protein [Dioscorea alata]|uniref:Tetratricopeptide-like helical domain-containing protein n=1 Tax=Dioscorea alata TaxID=55571 RepID=A0ACB7V4D4_DIOAL|nr:Tetratricopeptide-like helical domain-containing protein [Dioscorea alata]